MTILTEKKTVADKYIEALGLRRNADGIYESADHRIRLTWAAGHLYKIFDAEDYDPAYKAWKRESLPIIPDRYRYKSDPAKAKTRKSCEDALRRAVREGDEIAVATDPDREGEVIARLILAPLKTDREKVSRIWLKEGLEKSVVLQGIRGRKKDSEYDMLAMQGFAQKESDWCMGINMTRVYTLLNRDLYSVGRVQTAVLKKIYERQCEIIMFRPKPYYTVRCVLSDGTEAWLLDAKTGKKEIESGAYAEGFVSWWKQDRNAAARVEEVKSEEERKMCPRLYDSAGLQQDAFAVYGIDVDETLETAQRLYQEKGALSYPRTDSVCLGDDNIETALASFRELAEHDPKYRGCSESWLTAENKRLFSTREIGAHHGLIPSHWIGDDGSGDWKIWDLVARRFMMQTAGLYITETVTAELEAGGYRLEAQGSAERQEGWHALELRKGEKRNGQKITLAKGATAGIREAVQETRHTEPPKFYNQGTLVAFMRNPGSGGEEGVNLMSIGTEATQASVIKTLFTRGYVRTEKKHIEITEKGTRLVEQIKENRILDENTEVKATTEWERLGKESPQKLRTEIERVTRLAVEAMEDKLETEIKKQVVAVCPSCGGNIVRGKKGYYCTGYKEKECRNSISFHIFGNEMDDAKVRELFDKKEMPFMDGTTKDGERIKFRLAVKDGKVVTEYCNEGKEICACPKCGSAVKEFRKVYKCTSGSCDFFLWKETSGMKFTPEDAADLCTGKTVRKVQVRKDGTKADAGVSIGRDAWKLGIEY